MSVENLAEIMHGPDRFHAFFKDGFGKIKFSSLDPVGGQSSLVKDGAGTGQAVEWCRRRCGNAVAVAAKGGLEHR
jgi:hypothetical protein